MKVKLLAIKMLQMVINIVGGLLVLWPCKVLKSSNTVYTGSSYIGEDEKGNGGGMRRGVTLLWMRRAERR